MRKIFIFLLMNFCAITLAATTSNTTSTTLSPREEINISGGLGAAVIDGDVGWGPSFNMAMEVYPGSSFFMGLDLGVHFWNQSNPGYDPLKTLLTRSLAVRVTSIQLLPSFYYRFFLPMLPGAVPFLGVSLGPNIYNVEGTNVSTGAQRNELQIFTEVLVRGGVHWIFTDTLAVDIEPKMGLLHGKVVFLPQASLNYSL